MLIYQTVSPGCVPCLTVHLSGQGLAYASIVNADTTTIRLAADHQATEQLLRDSGVPYVLLRNSWYHENYTDRLPACLAQGGLPGGPGEGRVRAAAGEDYAAAAVRVLTTDG